MSVVVFDDFSFSQGNNVPNAGPDTSWGPTATRTTISNGTAVSNVDTDLSNRWHVTTGTFLAEVGSISYDYAVPQDFNQLLSITVSGTTGGDYGSLRLNLNDGSLSESKPPIDTTLTSATWNLSQFSLVDKSSINLMNLTLFASVQTNAEVIAEQLSSVLICVAKDTQVLMADGAQKPIQDIVRGDLVAGDSNGTTSNKVARLLHNKLPGIANVGVVDIQPNALGKNQPHTKLKITGAHPILYNGGRHRALRFRKFPGVKYHGKRKTKAENILPKNDDGTYSLYNIQFEQDGYFVANGLTVDSVPVLCPRLPLPKELFFDQELYNKPSTVVVPPLDKGVLKPPQ